MKRVLFATICTAITMISHAKIWRVNNTLGITADFTNTIACFNSPNVHDGDTVHIEASTTQYQNFTISKRLVIIGPGYFLSETAPLVTNPKTQASANNSYMDYIRFAPGSKGSVISGIACYRIELDDSLVTVQRCRIYGGGVTVNIEHNIYADTIRQNALDGPVGSYNDNTVKAENLIIYNNIFYGYYCLYFYGNSSIYNTTGYFINNSCIGSGSSLSCINFTFQNNIFNAPYLGVYLSSNVFFNCIESGNTIPATNGNVLNANMDNVYIGWNNAAGYSSDGRFKLKPASPAIAAGNLNGGPVDCGAFGGPAPYVLSGLPSVPSIYAFTAPGTVSNGTTTMNVTISTTSH